MAKVPKKSNPLLVALIDDLKTASREHEVSLWRDLARRLARPSRNWATVNLSRIERHTAKGDVVVVPGNVLAGGSLSKAVTVSAFHASQAAQAKVAAAGGDYLPLRDLMAKHPKGRGVRIVG